MEILAHNLKFPEGPVFDGCGRLWFVELQGGTLCRLEANEVRRWPTGGAPNGLAVDSQDRIWICDAGRNAVLRFDPQSETFDVVCDRVEGAAPWKANDLAFDRHGNLLFSCPGDSRENPTGFVCCLTPAGVARKIITDQFFPNGLLCTDRKLYLAETYRRRIWVGDWDGRKWSNPEILAETDSGLGPDGLAMDVDGRLYAAVFGAGHIAVIDTVRGEMLDPLALPGKNPTNCAFDPGSDDLIVTEAEHGQLLRLNDVARGRRPFTDRYAID